MHVQYSFIANMKCKQCSKEISKKRKSIICDDCEEKNLWKQFNTVQKKITKLKCVKKKLKKKDLISHLKDSIKSLEDKEKELVCFFHSYGIYLSLIHI